MRVVKCVDMCMLLERKRKRDGVIGHHMAKVHGYMTIQGSAATHVYAGLSAAETESKE